MAGRRLARGQPGQVSTGISQDSAMYQGDVAMVPASQVQPHLAAHRPKSLRKAYLWGLLGMFGAHHFYLGRPRFGVLYLFTVGLCVIGWILDLLRMPLIVKQANDRSANPDYFKKRKSVLDAYILWMPLGLLGFHQYYLGRLAWGVAYTFTCGLLGVGWLIDGFRMTFLVKDVNDPASSEQRRTEEEEEDERNWADSFVLSITPLGLLGGHHYYMERYLWGVTYTFTVGLCGVGWLHDIIFSKKLFDRAMKIRRNEIHPGLKYVDEAYKLCFPLGFLGLHHFYLRRPGWGVLYFFTVGGLGIGWIIDFFRIRQLVAEANDDIEQQQRNMQEISAKIGQQNISPKIQRKISRSGFTVVPPANNPAYPPGTYPPGTYPPGTYPPATYPPGTYPYQPGVYPPQFPYPTANLDPSQLAVPYAGGAGGLPSDPPPYSAEGTMPAISEDAEEEEEEEEEEEDGPEAHDNAAYYDNSFNDQMEHTIRDSKENMTTGL